MEEKGGETPFRERKREKEKGMEKNPPPSPSTFEKGEDSFLPFIRGKSLGDRLLWKTNFLEKRELRGDQELTLCLEEGEYVRCRKGKGRKVLKGGRVRVSLWRNEGLESGEGKEKYRRYEKGKSPVPTEEEREARRTPASEDSILLSRHH